ncbi:MAG: EAL domain-containing protein, partial [Anaerolineae bacterium]|nr:EAL domain-containing protein [Anaerolineae bacterium]
SALGSLKELPVQQLKIDHSFIRNLTSNPKDVVLVRSMIDMAHGLGLRVIAEGVET